MYLFRSNFLFNQLFQLFSYSEVVVCPFFFMKAYWFELLYMITCLPVRLFVCDQQSLALCTSAFLWYTIRWRADVCDFHAALCLSQLRSSPTVCAIRITPLLSIVLRPNATASGATPLTAKRVKVGYWGVISAVCTFVFVQFGCVWKAGEQTGRQTRDAGPDAKPRSTLSKTLPHIHTYSHARAHTQTHT